MNTKKIAVATLMLLATASGFAAESSAPADAASDKLNLPVLNAPSDTPREAAKAEAVDLVKNYKTTLSVQLDQYKP